jgi:hypothetical protein
MTFLVWFLQALAIFYMLLFVHALMQRIPKVRAWFAR